MRRLQQRAGDGMARACRENLINLVALSLELARDELRIHSDTGLETFRQILLSSKQCALLVCQCRKKVGSEAFTRTGIFQTRLTCAPRRKKMAWGPLPKTDSCWFYRRIGFSRAKRRVPHAEKFNNRSYPRYKGQKNRSWVERRRRRRIFFFPRAKWLGLEEGRIIYRYPVEKPRR